MNINVNTIINDSDSEAQYIVLWVSADKKYGYWHNLTSASRTVSDAPFSTLT